MKYFWAFLGSIWSNWKIIGVTLCAAVLFFVSMFPFTDLSDMVTSIVARSTNNQIYLQFESIDLHLLPVPAVSAQKVSIETPAMEPVQAAWLKVAPNLLDVLFNIFTLKRALAGDPEAAALAQSRLGASIDAEGVFGADVDLQLGQGSKGEGGSPRSKVSLEIDQLSLGEVGKWASLPMSVQGQADLVTVMQFTPGFAEQPEGEFELRVSKFNMPASTVMVPMNGARMPLNLPTLTLANVTFKGRLVGGSLVLEEGSFGKSQDPIFGRIKGQMALRLQPVGNQIQPILGQYNLTVDLNTSKQIEKDIGIAFILFESAKTPTPTGSRYLFRAQGQGVGTLATISRINSF